MAGRIPDHFLDELLSRIDVGDVVGDRVQLKKSGSNLQGLCPFHSEKTPSFTVSQSKQFYHCFGCGAHGTAIRFLMEYDGLEFRDAVADLANRAGMSLPEGSSAPEPDDYAGVYTTMTNAAACYRQWLRRHGERGRAVDYLRQRGISGATAARFGLGFAPPGWGNLLERLGSRQELARAGLVIERDSGGAYDRFRDRILFPIHDRRGRVIGFGGRVLGDGEPKYLNSPDTPIFHKGQELYGLYELIQADRHPPEVVVVEGYMDVLALAEHGIPRATATLGTSTSTRQIERLFRVTRDLVFCFDGDAAGRQAAWRALEAALPTLREGRQVRFVFLSEGDDPDSLVRSEGRAGFEARVNAAQALSEYLFERLNETVDLATGEGRARLVEAALPLLQRLPPDVYRRLMVERLGSLARLETDYVADLVANRANRQRPAPSAARDMPAVRRTPVRLAVTLVLQRPSLASLVTHPEHLRDLALPGAEVLRQLLEIAGSSPQITPAALLERFRDSPYETALWRLATWDHIVPEAGIEDEFCDAIERLITLHRVKRLQYLDGRLQRGELTAKEWDEWTKLKQPPE